MPSAGERSRSLTALVDPNLHFPRRPRLVPDLDWFRLPDGLGFQFRGGPANVLLRGRVADAVLPWLVERLDGSHDVDALLAARPEAVSEAEVADALVLLLLRGLIDDADATPREAPAPEPLPDRQRLFFGRKLGCTRANPSGDAAQRRLAEARIALLGAGLFGCAAWETLARAGCEHLTLLDWGPGDELAAAVRAAGGAAEALDGDRDRLASRLEALLPGSDLFVTATRHAPDPLFELLNERALRHEARWLRGNETATAVEIGPYVDAHDSPCFVCMQLRARAADAFPIEEKLYQDRLGDPSSGAAGTLRGECVALAQAAGALLALEVTRIVTRIAPPLCEGAVLSLGFDGAPWRDPFLRVPRCPHCHRGHASAGARLG
jgi:bacteriocin biosynthesis cyclodehydratase domain-containing protein